MAQLRIEGGIGQAIENQDGTIEVINTAAQIRAQVEAMNMEEGETLDVSINSVGGNVYEGYAIYNFLRTFRDNLNMEGDGIIASISTLIMSAAKKENTSITEVSMFMIHRAMAPVMGNAEEMDKQSGILKKIDSTLVDIYANRSGIPKDEVLAMMSKETWLTGRETYEAGFVGKLTNIIPVEAVATAFNTLLKNNEMGLQKFIDRFGVKAEGDEEKIKEKEAKAELTEEEKEKEAKAVALTEEEIEIEKEEGAEEEIKEDEEPVTRAEFNALLEKIDAMADAVQNGLDASNKANEESEEKTNKVDEKVLNLVENTFNKMVAALPSSNGMPVETQVISNKTNAQPHAAFKEEMAEINKKAKAKLRKV